MGRYTNQRLLEPIGDIPTARFESTYYGPQASQAQAA